MYINSHESGHMGLSANLTRSEEFSRRQQQNNAILMNWDRRKAQLTLKDRVGVERKVLNSLKNVSIVYSARKPNASPLTGRVNLEEVTVFKVAIGTVIKEVIVRRHTSGTVLFQFLEKKGGKLRIEATGQRSVHTSIPEPYVTKSSFAADTLEVYKCLMIRILDYLIDGD